MRLILTVMLVAGSAAAQVKLAPLFTDHAVLERNKPIPVWGTAAAGEKVEVTLGASRASATADATGAWRATLPKMAAGGPYTLKANGVMAADVLIGEVWLASGQSNMEFTVKEGADPQATLAASDHPKLRMFTVKKNTSAVPLTAMTGSWAVSNATNLGDFSAVGYYFGAFLLAHLDVPVGVIHSSWGGTAAEIWTPLPNLLADPVFAADAQRQTDAFKVLPASIAAYKQGLAQWESQYGVREPADAKQPGEGSAWKSITLPASMEQVPVQGAAVLWLRRSVTLPADFPAGRARIDMGYLLERDAIFVNGQQISKGGYGDPEIGVPGRAADIPAGVLHPGENMVLVRAFAHVPSKPGVGRAQMSISAEGKTVPLTGEWQYTLTFDKALGADAIASFPQSPQMNSSATYTSLYNAMIAPLRDFPIAGTIWYQGESNAARAAQYPGLMKDMITGWRAQWGYDFPFYMVQLPLYSDKNYVAQRASQQQITKDVPNTAIAVTIDTGEVTNIHPKVKQPVGERLALLALHRVYGEKVEDSGPFFASAKVEGAKMLISFTHAEGLHATGATIPYFEVAGSDGNFQAADAVIEKDTIVLSSAQVEKPTAARYAWKAAPLGCDVYNGANLPLAPFLSTWEP